MKTFKLENEPKITTGFKTPDHYFDAFSTKVLQQIISVNFNESMHHKNENYVPLFFSFHKKNSPAQ